jgi:hypothetical protein
MFYQGWVSPSTATSMWSIVHPLLNFKLAAIPSQHWCYACPTYQRIVVPINKPHLSEADSTKPPPHLLEELDAMISRHTSTSTGAMLASPTREQWYLLLAPFCLRQLVPGPPICWRSLEALFGREMADNFAQRPPWGLRFFYVQ